MEETAPRRVLYLDLLKIISIFFVILIHVTAENWYGEVRTVNWLVNNGYNALSRWGVPVFVMVSGALLLPKEVSLRRIYLHYVPRIALMLLFWGAAYWVLRDGSFTLQGLWNAVSRVLHGQAYSHLWYLYMLIGLYLVTPLLHSFVVRAERKTLEYALALGFVFESLIPDLQRLPAVKAYADTVGALQLDLLGGFLLYYVAGYYFSRYQLTRRQRMVLYIAADVLLLGTMAFSEWKSWQINYQYVNYGVFSVGTALFSFALFVFFRQLEERMNRHPLLTRFTRTVGPLTFGIYLVHFLVEKSLLSMGYSSNTIPPLLGAPLLSAAIFVVCGAGCWVASRIPVLRRLIR